MRVVGPRALALDIEREGGPRRRLKIFRPATREECEPGGRFAARPCPFVSCRHHLMLEPEGPNIRFNFSELDAMEETCMLDAISRVQSMSDDSPMFDRSTGGMKVQHVSRLMNLAPEKVREIEARGLELLESAARRLSRGDEFEEDAERPGDIN